MRTVRGALIIGADASYSIGVAFWAARLGLLGREARGAARRSERILRGEAPAESGQDAEAVACIRAVATFARGMVGARVLVHNDNNWVVRHVLNGVPLPQEAKPPARATWQRRRAELLKVSCGLEVVGVHVSGSTAWYRELDSAAYVRMRMARPEVRP